MTLSLAHADLEIARFARAAAERNVVSLDGLVTFDRLLELETLSLQRLVDERCTPEWSERYRRIIPVSDADPVHYGLRHLDLGDLGEFLVGIHFLGQDSSRPFVGIEARTAPLATVDGLVSVERVLRCHFSRFRPRAIWLRHAHPPDLHGVGMADQHMVAADLAGLKAAPSSERGSRVLVRRLAPTMAAQLVASMYEELFVTEPQWRGLLYPSEASGLAACEACGAVAEVLVDGRSAGVLAAQRRQNHAMPGYEMIEQILGSAVRGQGLAAVVQREFLELLDCRHGDLVYGMIDASNERSLRTAARVGRRRVATWSFIGSARSRGLSAAVSSHES